MQVCSLSPQLLRFSIISFTHQTIAYAETLAFKVWNFTYATILPWTYKIKQMTFHLNAKSASNNSDDLGLLSAIFLFLFDVIMLTKTCYKRDTDAVQLENYSLFF